jgi:hypothetical protein
MAQQPNSETPSKPNAIHTAVREVTAAIGAGLPDNQTIV